MTWHMSELVSAFSPIAASAPFLGIAITFGVYFLSARLYNALGQPTLLHPLLITISGIAASLQVIGVEYEKYFEATKVLHLLLGPVVVLLAVPLWRQLGAARDLGPALLMVLLVGTVTGILTSVGTALLLSSPNELIATLAPKSVTTPVAIKLAESLGGVAPIAALVVILTGLVGATFGWPLLQALGISDRRAKGFAIGVASHVIGTARVFEIDQKAGAFSGMGMILNAIMTAALIGLVRFSFL